MNCILPCFNGISVPELVTGRGIVLSDVKIEHGPKYSGISERNWKRIAKITRKSGKHNGSMPRRKLYR